MSAAVKSSYGTRSKTPISTPTKQKARPAFATPDSTPMRGIKRAASSRTAQQPAKRQKSEAPVETEGRTLRSTPARKETVKSVKAPATPSKTPPRRGRSVKPKELDLDSEASEDEVVYAIPLKKAPITIAVKKTIAKRNVPVVTPTTSESSISSLPPSPLLEPVASSSRSSSPEPVETTSILTRPFSELKDADIDPDYAAEEALVEGMELEMEETREAPSVYPASLIKFLLINTLSCLHGRIQPYFPLASTSTSLASHPCLPGMKIYEQDLRATLDRTIKEGEGNCLLLVGPRTVGKSAIVQRTLSLLRGEMQSFLVVRLSGLVQISDRMALREIARQLCRDDDGVDDDGSAFTSNAATLASLLAILEPKEAIASSRDTDNTSKPIIFILDEFDLFALRDQRQSFLYCLLDIVQGKRRKGGMAVIGLSARTDCINTLEKRVKSRCQSRVHQIAPPSTLDDFLAVARCRTKANVDSLKAETHDDFLAKSLAAAWDSNMQTFFASGAVQNMADCVYSISKSKTELLSEVSKAVLKIQEKCDTAEEVALPQMKYGVPKAVNTSSLSTLSIVELSVLISAKHITSDGASFNLAMLYDLYKQHIKRNSINQSGARGFNKDVFARAFEQLCSLELIQGQAATGRSKATSSGPFKMCRLVLWYDQIDSAVYARSDVPQHLRKWCKTWTE